MEVTDYCGIVSGHKTDKSGLFNVFYGKLNTAPMIEECPLTMECKLVQRINLPIDCAVIGEIVGVYCDDKYMDGKMPDMAKMDPMIFSTADKTYWSIGKKLGDAWVVGKDYR
jgi:flavin reductase (DIM6/NTAB) family NADH-FMN oxidoreductase RutF